MILSLAGFLQPAEITQCIAYAYACEKNCYYLKHKCVKDSFETVIYNS